MPSDPILHRPKRSAHASIRGYLYQACLGALRWLELEDGEVLLCEGDEDLDRIFTSGQRTLEQVKDISRNLGKTVVRETLRNFLISWVHLRQQNETDDVRFVFTSTAEIGKGSPAWPLLNSWEDPGGLDERIETVRAWIVDSGGTEEDKEAIEIGLEWLDKGGGWAEFLGSIRWDLGQPSIEGIRNRIRQSLKARPDARDLPTEILVDRLVYEIFHASQERNDNDRQRDNEALRLLVANSQNELVQWAGSPEADRIRKAFDETEALRGLLDSGQLDLRELHADKILPSTLLTAGYEVVPFTGRSEEWNQIHDWCQEDTAKGVWLRTGEGGVGKSRFFIEVTRRLRHEGWHAGFLPGDVDSGQIPKLFQGTLPRLVVIDYAETRPEITKDLFARLARHEGEPNVRVVLLARQEGVWWRELFKGSSKLQHLGAAFSRNETLPALLDAEGNRRDHYRAAAQSFAERLGAETMPDPLVEPDLTRDEFERVLYLHMAALAALDGKRLDTAEDLLTATLEHERRFWRLKGPNALQEDDTVKLMATALAGFTLIGGAETEQQAKDWISHLLDLSNETATVRFIRKKLQGLYGTQASNIAPLMPDLLGEHLVHQTLGERPDLLDRMLPRMDRPQRRQMLTVLLRLATRTGDEAWLQRLETWLRKSQDEQEIDDFSAICGTDYFRDAVPLYEVALAADERTLEVHQQKYPNPTEADLAERARRWSNLGYRLADLGLRKRAFQATQRAVNIGETLAEKRPEEFLSGLARSLSNLSTLQAELGHYDDALQTTQRAVGILETLARKQPGTALPNLAITLNNLGVRHAELGHLEDALQATQQAVDFYEVLAEKRPKEFLSGLATSLNTLGNRYAELGHLENALQATQRAVDFFQKLAKNRPDAFLPSLAKSLINLGIRHAELGHPEEALQATQRVVDIRETLAVKRPYTFLPGLATSLNNLGTLQAKLGWSDSALQATEEAIGKLLPFFELRPKAHNARMRIMVGNYLERCEESDVEPNPEWMRRIEKVFTELEAEEAKED